MRSLFSLTEQWYLSNGGEMTSVCGKPWFYSQYDGYALSRGSENIVVSVINMEYYANKSSRYYID